MVIRDVVVSLAVVAASLGASPARADKLQDFKDAVAAKEGCPSIPYKDLSKFCGGKNTVMHEWCDGEKGPVSCDVGTTRILRDKLERERQNYEKLRDKKRDLEDKRYKSNDDKEKSSLNSEIDVVNKQIDESERTSNSLRTDIDKRKELLNRTIETIEKCIDHRQAIMNIFAESLDKVRGEPEDEIKPLARTLRDGYEAEKSGHGLAITARKDAKDKCKSELP